ncbi:hypothetical protein [Mesorhizobium sp. ISC11]|uniref:hypothetical protein n=1 Tax=Mesorhizobium sp. ISC11 TaxID=3076428 RepID=UPI00301C05F5
MSKTIEKVRVRIKENKKVYIHNDLSNAAYYFRARIRERFKARDHEGLGHEVMACLTMIAFAIEANVNFIGSKVMNPWDEALPTKEKMKLVSQKLGFGADFGKRPYQTVTELKQFRDALAHGKPIELTREFEAITTQEELDKSSYLQGEWEKFVDIEFVERAYKDMQEIWSELMKMSGLEVFDAITSGGRSIEFIEHVKG